ncbi:MAG: magnesium/cobalt transporter CorA [Endozoicomonadaceae bacterium]|nr:magnesium/cobalt transporter CorA [Endozoicomonadaceae bacterium]
MITVYRLAENQLKIENLSLADTLPGDALWLDVVEPDDQERKWLEQYYSAAVPGREALKELESTSRFYQDGDGMHIHSFFPHRQSKDIRLTSVSFNIRPHLLITLRDDDVGLFRLVRHQFKRNKLQVDSPMEIFQELFTAKIDYLADMLEDVYSMLEELSQKTLREDANADERDDILRTITIQEDINDKIRLCLLDTQRSIRYLMRSRSFQLSETHQRNMLNMLRDIESLSPHTQFLFGKMSFLLDAIMGFISHEQNNVNKIFSWIATMFLPPTLIGSIYGMNFKSIPEINWEYGYFFALTLMVLSAVIPYIYFKRKGWL